MRGLDFLRRVSVLHHDVSLGAHLTGLADFPEAGPLLAAGWSLCPMHWPCSGYAFDPAEGAGPWRCCTAASAWWANPGPVVLAEHPEPCRGLYPHGPHMTVALVLIGVPCPSRTQAVGQKPGPKCAEGREDRSVHPSGGGARYRVR